MVDAEHYGRGRRGHRIGLNGLLKLVTLLELRRVGISLPSIRKAAEALHQHTREERPLATLVIVIIGDDITWSDEGDIADLISARRQPGQRLIILPIGEKLEQLRQLLSEETASVESVK